jgi:hypothetical protein
MLSINILLCLFKISAEITCMSFVRNPCFPDVAFNSKDLIFKISFGWQLQLWSMTLLICLPS